MMDWRLWDLNLWFYIYKKNKKKTIYFILWQKEQANAFTNIQGGYIQSRSSLYAEYTRSVVPPRNTRGLLALKDDFILVLILNLASSYENMNDNVL